MGQSASTPISKMFKMNSDKRVFFLDPCRYCKPKSQYNEFSK